MTVATCTGVVRAPVAVRSVDATDSSNVGSIDDRYAR